MLKICRNCGRTIFIIGDEDARTCPECYHLLEYETPSDRQASDDTEHNKKF